MQIPRHSFQAVSALSIITGLAAAGSLPAQVTPIANNPPAPASNAVTTAAAPLPGRGGGRRGFAGGNQTADRQHMFEVLHITLPANLPPDAEDPNRPPNTKPIPGSVNWDDGVRGHTVVRSEWGTWANYDLSKADPYPLPDPLKLNDGQMVKDEATWWQKRRLEILRDFHTEIYGNIPESTPKVTWTVAGITTNADAKTITKKVVGHVDNSSCTNITVNIGLTVTTPSEAAGPVPVIFRFGGGGFGGGGFAGGGGGGGANDPTRQILQRGWGYGFYDNNSVQPGGGAGLRSGIIGLMNKGEFRKPDDWGALMAWAWGFDRCLDYMETDRNVDARKVGLAGHSFLGKATIVAMAFDQRLAIAYPSCAGESGTKLHRHILGESVENTCSQGEYYEMAGNFLKYAGHCDQVPVDSHELIALCAPRPVFVTGGTEDLWSDPVGEFKACVAAGPVYRLLGKRDLGTTEMPAPDIALLDGDVAFREHTGGHTDAPDWPAFLKFADKYFTGSSAAKQGAVPK
ncbi:MAG: acetylxylan esterase [Verrucomicrobiota bacterium]|jgi:hypothetical protein